MKDSGIKTWQMDLEFICIHLVQFIKAIGKIIFKMVLEFNCGQTRVNIKETINSEKNMDKVNILGQTEVFIRDFGKTTKYQDMANIFGQMEKVILGNG